MVTRRDTPRGELTIVRDGHHVRIIWWDNERYGETELVIPLVDTPMLVAAMVADGLVTEETYATRIP